MKKEELKQRFKDIYAREAQAIYFAPGRVNLIGEHTDYNGGVVFPCALSFGTYCLIRKNKSHQFRIKSLNQKEGYNVAFKDIATPLDKGAWANYVIGVLAQFVKNKHSFSEGADMLFWGNVPKGAGLSSSAALEVVTAVAINNEYQFNETRINLVKYSQKAEHEFAGVMCGIMDQFASGMGQKDCALYLNCDSMEYDLVPIKLEGIRIVIGNTNSPHSLDAGKYNQRVEECRKAVEYIRREKNISLLGDLSLSELEEKSELITDKIIYRRALHVVSEINRTKQAVIALRKGDITLFGNLMNQSHDSLRDNYEVTGFELDTMVNAARKIDGVIGSRMTGGGFGGSTVSLVREENIADFITRVGAEYREKTGLKAEFYVADIGDGGRKIEL